MSADRSVATVFHNGIVLTMVKGDRPARALVIRDGRIVAAGDNAEMKSLAAPDAEHVDLRGAVLMPGLIDTHPHMIHFGISAMTHVDLSDAKSHDDIISRIRERASSTPKGEWIRATPIGEPHY